MTQSEFETKWHNNVVEYKGGFWEIPHGKYLVTAALIDDNGEVTFGIMNEDKFWYTISTTKYDLDKLDSFKIVGHIGDWL